MIEWPVKEHFIAGNRGAVIIRLLNGTRISDVSWKLCGVLFGKIALSVMNLSEA